MADPSDEGGREEREIKVTDRRMFTAEGELKEEFRDLGSSRPEAAAGEAARDESRRPPAGADPAGTGSGIVDPSGASAGGPSPGAGPAPSGGPPPGGERPSGPAAGGGGAPFEIPSSSPGPAPTFYDLISVLAEPVALYLGDAQLPDGSSAENLDAARLYIDLLDVVRNKTAGNLSAQETTVLEDVLYQLRMRYVQKRG